MLLSCYSPVSWFYTVCTQIWVWLEFTRAYFKLDTFTFMRLQPRWALPSALIRWQCTSSTSSTEICKDAALLLWDHKRKTPQKHKEGGDGRREEGRAVPSFILINSLMKRWRCVCQQSCRLWINGCLSCRCNATVDTHTHTEWEWIWQRDGQGASIFHMIL